MTEPLDERVLDPACGSGTFLFHAVRRYLAASEDAGVPLASALQRLTDQVMGLDLHPVAVALARVTYLLGIGRGRLISGERGPITVPVYLGDSLQWEQRIDLYTADHLVIPTNDEAELFASELRFPDRLLADAARFDRLVAMLTDLAAKPRPHGSVPSLSAVFRLLAVDEVDRPAISETFATLCRLHDEGRDHIWSFYIRNLARPAWLSRPDNRVDVLMGNPPWLAYRNMPRAMQKTFKTMSESRGLWHGATVATHQDLSGLFLARTVQQYLRQGGRLAFVMPNAALDRDQFAGFRQGNYPDPAEPTAVAFDTPWDLRRLRPHFFHRAACVVFGTRASPRTPSRMPTEAEQWRGRLPQVHATWEEIESQVVRERGLVTIGAAAGVAGSPYGSRFAQGASVVPRMLFVVEKQPSGPLGLAAGSLGVRSARSAYEKVPWKDLPAVEGVVETDFVRRLYLGESVLPFRLLPPRLAVIPLEGGRLLDGDSDRIDLYPAWLDGGAPPSNYGSITVLATGSA